MAMSPDLMKLIAGGAGKTAPAMPQPGGEQAAGPALIDSSPLLEEKGHTSGLALIADLSDPIGVHWPGPRPRLTPHNHPADLLTALCTRSSC